MMVFDRLGQGGHRRRPLVLNTQIDTLTEQVNRLATMAFEGTEEVPHGGVDSRMLEMEEG